VSSHPESPDKRAGRSTQAEILGPLPTNSSFTAKSGLGSSDPPTSPCHKCLHSLKLRASSCPSSYPPPCVNPTEFRAGVPAPSPAEWPKRQASDSLAQSLRRDRPRPKRRFGLDPQHRRAGQHKHGTRKQTNRAAWVQSRVHGGRGPRHARRRGTGAASDPPGAPPDGPAMSATSADAQPLSQTTILPARNLQSRPTANAPNSSLLILPAQPGGPHKRRRPTTAMETSPANLSTPSPLSAPR